ncbi:hypothetical protein [Microbacterium sp.]|jgi:hypothetical protein|uniref:hypothetical protein n=1 Tax=Microbacterium sp. TaxID=51671 RepID=UPI0037C5E4AA
MSDDAFWWPHLVRIRPLLRGAGMGPRLGDPATEPTAAEVDDEQRLVRRPDGVQVPSSARVTVPIDTIAPLGSEVTIWPGRAHERTAAVIAVSREDNGVDLPSQLVLTLE